MSIRVSQPAINLREKLTEIDTPPIGAHGSELMNSSSPKETFDLMRAGRKNMIVNGDMQIFQRTTNTSGKNSSGYFAADMWRHFLSGAGTWTLSQDTDVPEGQGFVNSYKLDCTTADAAIDSSDYFIVEQRIEALRMVQLGWGTHNAKPVTLSFWVKASITGECNAMFHGDGFSTARIINQTFTIDRSDTWEYKTMTFPAPGSEYGFTLNSNYGIRMWLWFKAGSQWTAGAGNRNYWRNNADNQQAPGTTINIASSTSNNLWITGVQLEEGNNATPFEFKTYDEQLRDCQRYLLMWPARSGGAPIWPAYTGSGCSCSIAIPHSMRAVPTPTDLGTGTSTTTGHVYHHSTNVSSRYSNGSSPTLSCGGTPHYPMLVMNFGSHQSGDHKASVASWNGQSPGIVLSAEL